MIRRQFLKLFGQLSVLAFVLKGQTAEQMTSDLTPTVDPQAISNFQQYTTVLASGPLLSGPLCGHMTVRHSNE